MKITQREFVDAMTTNNSYFAGVARDIDFDDVLYWGMELAKVREKENPILNMRSAVKKSHELVFSGGSHLDLTNRTFYRLDCTNLAIYICRIILEDEMYGNYDKSMIYIVFT